ncbi:MAG: lysophospholipid acyltransferase family protein [Acidobacteriota bacterium]
MIRTVLVVAITFLYIFVTGPPVLLVTYLTRSTRLLYMVGRTGIRMALRLGGMTTEAHGREKVDPSKACVYVVNHESIIDPLLLYAHLPHDCAGLGKKEFFRLPVLGWACRMAGFVVVDRQNPEQRMKVAPEAVKRIKERGRAFLVFGEGTRSRDGRLGVFKKGAAIIAIQAQVNIVPVAVYGGFALWPKGRKFFKPGHLRIFFLDPISTAGMTIDDRDRLTATCRERIADCLRRIDPDLVPDDAAALAMPQPS